MQSKPVASAPSPEELARSREKWVEIAKNLLWDSVVLQPAIMDFDEVVAQMADYMQSGYAALLRSRMERAERPTLTRFDVYPWLEQSARKSGWNVGRFIQTIEEAGHLEELADTLLAFESRPLPAAPDTEKKA